jgi:hypothetical protein
MFDTQSDDNEAKVSVFENPSLWCLHSNALFNERIKKSQARFISESRLFGMLLPS